MVETFLRGVNPYGYRVGTSISNAGSDLSQPSASAGEKGGSLGVSAVKGGARKLK